MIVMLDGTNTVLGTQIAPALFGYIFGLLIPIACYFVGRHCYDAWTLIHRRHERLNVAVAHGESQEMTEQGLNNNTSSNGWWYFFARFWGINVTPLLLVIGLFATFITADFYSGILFYRKVWLSCLMAPIGALVRLRLSTLNSRRGYWKRLEWVPWGTLTANLIAVVVSVIAEACEDRLVEKRSGNDWLVSVLPALETGFAGSLSTVSTFLHEIVNMKETSHMYIYGLGSVMSGLCLGLVFYLPIIRK
jgi:fluoride ion exporter CrcB/FEX